MSLRIFLRSLLGLIGLLPQPDLVSSASASFVTFLQRSKLGLLRAAIQEERPTDSITSKISGLVLRGNEVLVLINPHMSLHK